MLVRDEYSREFGDIFFDGCEPLADFSTAKTGIDQQPRSPGADEERIPTAATGQNADFDDRRPPLPLSAGKYFRTDSRIIVLASYFYNEMMKARVYVSMKPTVLDPQGQTICSALHGLGYGEIASVRQGKYFEIVLAEGAPRDSTARKLEEVARDVLSNPVIEEYRVEILD